MDRLRLTCPRFYSFLRLFLRSSLVVWMGALLATAQQVALAPGISRFDLPESGLEWRTAAHPLRFFDATGRRAGVFGKQTGQCEAWIYPIKILHGFRLEFRQEGMVEPVRGEAILEQVVVRPESTTLVYVHPSFTVRQTIWVPLEEPAIVVFLDVDSSKPLAITAKFVPDFKPMWPASLGGQHSYWLEEEKAFGLTDGTGRPTAIIGSPTAGAFTEFMDHQLIGGEMLLQLRVEPQQARKLLFSLVMALSMENSAKARAAYRSVLERVRELYEQRVRYHREFFARTMEIETPDPELNRAFTWAKVAIDAGWVCHPTYGCGLVAGYGPSGDGERPGFAWWFGGDALMATWALEDYGDLEGALQVLRFLKARQRADGKMMHEMTQSVDLIDWFGKYGFAYYHADTTPMYIYSIAQYWRRTSDKKFLLEFWPSVKKAYEYCVSTVDPKDGLMDNTKAGLAAVEVGPLRGKVVKDIYLEGFWLAALDAMRWLAFATDDTVLSSDVHKRISVAAQSLNKEWWNPEGRHFAFGLTAEGRRGDLLGNWPAVLLALAPPELSPDLLRPGVESLAHPELATDWGTRWLSNKDPLYDPLSYNNGSVWPFMSGFVAWAQHKHDRLLGGFAPWSSTARLTGLMSPGALPELMNGDRFRPGERSVPHQLFSSVGVVVPAVRGLLGLEVFTPKESIFVQPQLPAHWPFVRFSRFALWGSYLSGEVRHQPGRITITLEYDSKEEVMVHLNPTLPVGARVRRVLLNSRPSSFYQLNFGISLTKAAEVVIEYEGGIGIVPPEPRPEPGDRTTALKIIRVEHDPQKTPRAINLTLAGLGGRTYHLDLVTSVPSLTAEGATVRKTDKGYRLEISFEGSDYVTRQIRLRF